MSQTELNRRCPETECEMAEETLATEKHLVKVFTLLSPSMTMTGTEVAGQRYLAGRGLSQFHRTITCKKGKQIKLRHQSEYNTVIHLHNYLQYFHRRKNIKKDHIFAKT